MLWKSIWVKGQDFISLKGFSRILGSNLLGPDVKSKRVLVHPVLLTVTTEKKSKF